ncbi:MAG: arrestin family protein [Candidatus Thorarchaeota archaeon]
MRDVEIFTTKTQYRAGDAVEGQVIVRCDDEFKHNGIRITFKGREHTRVVVSHGKTSTTYTDEYVYFDETVYLEEAGVMQPGEKGLEFRFLFPEDPEVLLTSYQGRSGWIEYSLEAVVEISLAIDPKSKVYLDFQQAMIKPGPLSQRLFAEEDGYPVLDVEMEDTIFCIGDSIPLRFRVAHDVKIREVRASLISNEVVIAQGHKRNSKKTLVKKKIDDDHIQRDRWMDVTLETNESMQSSFDRPIIRNTVLIKVTLNIPWARDKIVEIPITLGHCEARTDLSYDIFDF